MLLQAGEASAGSDLQLRQYRHKAWRTSDGWFEGAVNALAQGTDGYLWVGTSHGAYRFDGVRFEPYLPAGHKPFGFVYAFLATREGAVWIAAESGLSVWKDGALVDIPSAGAQITSVSADRDGTVWVTRNGVKDGSGPVCRVTQAKTLKCFGEPDGIATHYAQNIVQDARGDYWIAAGAVTRWRPGSKGTVFFSDELSGFGTGWGVQTLMIDTDGSVLAGLSVSGKTAGLQRYKDGHWSAVATRTFDGSVHSAGRLFRDHEGALWVYTLDDSLGRVDGDRFELFGPAQGLSGETVSAILEDREETIWVATDRGIDSFTRPAVVTFTEKDGTWIHSNLLFADADGALWLGR